MCVSKRESMSIVSTHCLLFHTICRWDTHQIFCGIFKTAGNNNTHRELRWGLLVVIEVINYEWVELIFINYLLIASTLSSCHHCACNCVHVCQTIWVRGWVGGDFNWHMSCRWSKWGAFYCELQKTRWFCRALTGCLNDAGMSDSERIWMKFPLKWVTACWIAHTKSGQVVAKHSITFFVVWDHNEIYHIIKILALICFFSYWFNINFINIVLVNGKNSQTLAHHKWLTINLLQMPPDWMPQR